MTEKELDLMRRLYDQLKLYTDNGKNDHKSRLILREYETSTAYREPYDLKKGYY